MSSLAPVAYLFAYIAVMQVVLASVERQRVTIRDALYVTAVIAAAVAAGAEGLAPEGTRRRTACALLCQTSRCAHRQALERDFASGDELSQSDAHALPSHLRVRSQTTRTNFATQRNAFPS